MTLKVYTKTLCPACVALKARLSMNSINYIEVNVDDDADAKQFLINQGFRSVPQMFKDNVHVKDIP